MPHTTSASQVPVTVLTGYLGAGKTTLLNRILSEDHGKKYAVIVNEFGEIGIDNDLVVGSDEEVFEMNNGCICCTVRGDLVRIIGGLMKRKERFDAILVETTGLADPAPVAQTFFADEDVAEKTRLDAVVTVADAKHLALRLDDSREAKEQIAFADVILLNKTDLVTAAELSQVESRIRSINPYAKVIRTNKCAVDSKEILDRGAFSLDRILTLEPDFLTHDYADEHDHDHDHDHHDHHHEHEHHNHHHGKRHDDEIGSLSLREDRPLDPDKFGEWIRTTLADQGAKILRSKGILQFRGEAQRYVLQAVHMMMDGGFTAVWGENEPRYSRFVFIGRDLDHDKLRAGFASCVAD